MDAETLTELLPAERWLFMGACTCGGTERRKYKLKGTSTELHILPNKDLFRLFVQGSMAQERKLSELSSALTTL